MFVKLAINLLMYYSLPKKHVISLLVLSASMLRMALILSGFVFMPLSLTMYPNNFSEVTLKVHFLGFNLDLNCLIFSKNLSKAAK